MKSVFDFPVKTIAVLRALQLGDVLCAIPALRALRAAHPRASITFIGLPWASELMERLPHYVNHFLEFPGFPGLPERTVDAGAFPEFLATLQAQHFDVAIQLHGSGPLVNSLMALMGAKRTAGFVVPEAYCPDVSTYFPYPVQGHEIDRLLHLTTSLGMPAQGSHLEFPLRERDFAGLDAHPLFQRLHSSPYVCLHPGARWESRRWKAEGFADVGRALYAKGMTIVLTGSRAERTFVERIGSAMGVPYVNAAGETTLGLMGALLQRARLLVCNDTGVSHLAAAVHTASIVLGLGSEAARWAPLDAQRHRLLSVPVDCRPCMHRECPIDHACSIRLSSEHVIQTALTLLKEKKCHETSSAYSDLAYTR